MRESHSKITDFRMVRVNSFTRSNSSIGICLRITTVLLTVAVITFFSVMLLVQWQAYVEVKGECLQLVDNNTKRENLMAFGAKEKTYQSAKLRCLATTTCAGIGMTLPSARRYGQVVTFSMLLHARLINLRSITGSQSGVKFQYIWRREICSDAAVKMPPAELPPTGFKVGGRETIFIQATTYRDRDCHVPILTGFQRAKHPDRIFFGVLYQADPGDFDCSQAPVECSVNPEHVMCKYRNNIIFQRTNASDARGPTYARYLADQLYGNQTYIMQIDGHMSFTNNWDEVAIDQFTALNNEMAVLSTYVQKQAGCIDELGNVTCQFPPVIVRTSIENSTNSFRHHTAMVLDWHPSKPLLNPLLGAGLVFSKGHRVITVPNDCCSPWVFSGEEFVLGARLLTRGYDIYAPSANFVLHPYYRKNILTFWEQRRPESEAKAKAAYNRLRKILGQELTGPYEVDRIDEYRLSTERDFKKILTVYGINLSNGTMADYTQLIFQGDVDARLSGFMTPHGVDYSLVPDDLLTRDVTLR